MKKPVVDYRKLRLSNRNSPEYAHLKLLWGWVVYFILFILTENLIPYEKCTPVHCFLDDLIPFCEIFVIPYVFWYLLIIFSLGYFLLYDIDNFKNLQKYIIITQVVAMACYILFPSRQDLRPTAFERENFLTNTVSLLYNLDTSTGVCPSLHVAYSIGIGSTWLRKQDASVWWKTFIVVSVILICLSTMFIKQHSAVDFFAAIPVCLLAQWLVFGRKSWRNHTNESDSE